MRVFSRRYIIGIIAALLLLPTVSLLAYTPYTAEISTQDTSAGARAYYPVLLPFNTSGAISLGMLDSDGLQSSLKDGATPVKYLLTGDKVAYVIPALGAGESLLYNLTLGESSPQTNFPIIVGDGGYITRADTATLEPGDNFELVYDGYVETSAGVSKYLANKEGALSLYVSGEGEITASIDIDSYLSDTAYLIPNATGYLTELTDYPSAGSNWEKIDEAVGAPSTGDYVYNSAATDQSDLYNLTEPSLPSGAIITSVEVYMYIKHAASDTATSFYPLLRLGSTTAQGPVTTRSSTSWVDVTKDMTASRPGGGPWTTADLNTLQAGIRLDSDAYTYGYGLCAQLYVIVGYGYPATVSLAAADIESGEHEVKVSADGTNLYLYVDDVLEDTVALGGASIIDSAADWVFMQNNVSPYIDYISYSVSGTPQFTYEPTSLISGTTLVDEVNSFDGTITWGTNDDLTLSSTGLESTGVYEPGGGSAGTLPVIIEAPTTAPDMFIDPTAAMTNTLPYQDLVNPAATSLDWSSRTLYTILAIIVAIGLSVGVTIATGSLLLGATAAGIILLVGWNMSIVSFWVVLAYAIMVLTYLVIVRSM